MVGHCAEVGMGPGFRRDDERRRRVDKRASELEAQVTFGLGAIVMSPAPFL